MITFSRLLARHVRSHFRRALQVTKSHALPIVFTADAAGLTIQAHSGHAAVAYFQPGALPAEQYVVPWDFLAACEGNRADPVTLDTHDGRVRLHWTDRQVPRTLTCDVEEPPTGFPSAPAQTTTMDTRFLSALRAAMETTDSESLRYALDCVQIRGSRGDLVTTDGHQLLIQGGFTFPWTDDILVRGSKRLFARDLAEDQPLEIGRTETHFVLRSGPWTVWLAIDRERRFPHTDDLLRSDQPLATLRLDDSDARFLADAVDLPGTSDADQPITVDLNGHVAILAKAADEPRATQLLLSNSQREGEATRFATNRFYLARAVRLGFRELQVLRPDQALQCRDEHRHYVWMPLGKDCFVSPDADTEIIESPRVSGRSVSKPVTRSRSHPVMSTNRISSAVEPPAVNGHSAPGSHRENTNGLLAKAEAAKAALRTAHTQISELIVALKRQRRQSQLMRSTLASLKELQTLDV